MYSANIYYNNIKTVTRDKYPPPPHTNTLPAAMDEPVYMWCHAMSTVQDANLNLSVWYFN